MSVMNLSLADRGKKGEGFTLWKKKREKRGGEKRLNRGPALG